MTFANIFGFGRVTVVDDSGELQRLQVTTGAIGDGIGKLVSDKVPRFTEFGFSSAPPIDAELVTINRNGDRSKPLVIATSHRPSRPKDLKPGDTILYDVRGAKVLLGEDGIMVDATGLAVRVQNATTVTIVASEKVRVEADRIECTGDVVSRCDGEAVSLNALRDAYHAHKHTGVTAGTASSGLTDHDI